MTRVFGHRIPAARVTWAAAFLLAAALSVPVFGVLSLIEWLLS